jgi:hypothetical protein
VLVLVLASTAFWGGYECWLGAESLLNATLTDDRRI